MQLLQTAQNLQNFRYLPTLFYVGTADLAIGSLRKWRNRFISQYYSNCDQTQLIFYKTRCS